MANLMNRRIEQANDTRKALIRAARTLFAEKGFHGSGTPEIAEQAGVTRGALQHHYPKKEDLFLAVFEQVQKEMAQTSVAQEGDELGDTWNRLKANINLFLEAATTREVQQIILIDGPAVLGWANWRQLERLYGLGAIELGVLDGIDAGFIRPQDPCPLAHLILSIIHEAALMVANADEPKKAMASSMLAMQTLLSSLE